MHALVKHLPFQANNGQAFALRVANSYGDVTISGFEAAIQVMECINSVIREEAFPLLHGWEFSVYFDRLTTQLQRVYARWRNDTSLVDEYGKRPVFVMYRDPFNGEPHDWHVTYGIADAEDDDNLLWGSRVIEKAYNNYGIIELLYQYARKNWVELAEQHRLLALED